MIKHQANFVDLSLTRRQLQSQSQFKYPAPPNLVLPSPGTAQQPSTRPHNINPLPQIGLHSSSSGKQGDDQQKRLPSSHQQRSASPDFSDFEPFLAGPDVDIHYPDPDLDSVQQISRPLIKYTGPPQAPPSVGRPRKIFQRWNNAEILAIAHLLVEAQLIEICGPGAWSEPHVQWKIQKDYPILLKRSPNAIAAKVKNSTKERARKNCLKELRELIIANGSLNEPRVLRTARAHVQLEMQIYGVTVADFMDEPQDC